MTETILKVDGMACGMCESHINDTVRNKFSVQKVTSSHTKGETVILSEQPLDQQALRDAIAATGVYLDYDTIGRFKYHSDEEEVALLRHMCERGYTQRLLLSLDTTAQRMAAYGGEISLCYLLERFLPRLEAAGFPPGTLADFTVLNCRRLFAG